MKRPVHFWVIFIVILILAKPAYTQEHVTDTNSLVFAELKTEVVDDGKSIQVARFIQNNKIMAIQKFFNNDLIEKSGTIPDGLILVLYNTGQINSLITYKNQTRNGLATSYFKDGNLQMITYYKNGYPEGKSIIYHPNGQVNVEAMYSDTKEIYYKQFDLEGNLVFERHTNKYQPEK